MAEEKYTLNRLQTLQHCLQVDGAGQMIRNIGLASSFQTSVSKEKGNGEILGKHLLVVSPLTLDKEFDFTFNNVHALSRPVEVEQAPMVCQVVLQEGNAGTLFVRMKCDLIYYDGVRALHTMFQLLEWLDSKGDISKVSTYPFNAANVSEIANENRFGRFFAHMGRVLAATVCSICSSKVWKGEWQRGPLQSLIEHKMNAAGEKRQCRRYNAIPSGTSFKDVAKSMDAIKQLLGREYYAATVNFPQDTPGKPSVAVTLVPDLKSVLSKEKRLKNLTVPPVGHGPPPPMDATAMAILFNCMFMNNYGRHTLNLTSEARVVDVLWDWQGMYTTFVPFFFIVEIQGKLFVRCCAPPGDWDEIEASGALSNLGQGVRFDPSKFYQEGEQKS